MRKFNTKRLVQISLLIALEIVLSRFLSIPTPIVKIGFAFLPLAMIGMLYGPVYGGIAGAIADIIGATLFPFGPFFPGFTLTAILTGATYGLFLHDRPKTLARIVCCACAITVFWHLGLNTLWVHMMYGKAILAILPARLLQNAVLLPVQIAGIYLLATKPVMERILKVSA